MRRSVLMAVLALVLAVTSACTNKKVNNPLANVGSKQPDKVLFDRSMDAMKHNRFEVARMTLQTLINTYPESEYVARAKLGVADSWYAEGGSTALAQAEIQYKDFITFFPNMKEAAEAQLKVANIHYQQMEKADRDYTHAMRAEEEYRNVIQNYPDVPPLVKEAKQRLREVQEVLAQREYNIGRFYYLRQSFPAAIARLQTLVDRYPLYSGADQALYLIGQSHEDEIARIRQAPTCGKERTVGCIPEATKANMTDRLAKQAAEAYAKIITRYPAMDRAWDAKSRLEALNQPVPKPTRAAMELNKKEVASRQEPGMLSAAMGPFIKRPNTAKATKVGEPTMTDGPTVIAADVVRATTGAGSASSDTKVTSEIVNTVPAPNGEAPRSDAPPAANPPADSVPPADSAPADQPAQTADQSNPAGELKPNVSDANELKPNVAPNPGDANTLPPPVQTNELDKSTAAANTNPPASASSSSGNPDDLVDISSSKGKKKKGLKKLNPF